MSRILESWRATDSGGVGAKKADGTAVWGLRSVAGVKGSGMGLFIDLKVVLQGSEFVLHVVVGGP